MPPTHSCDPDVSTTGITINCRHSCDRHSTQWPPSHSCVLFCCALMCSLIAVLCFSRPALGIHSWSLQHAPARTYCSPSSCMRSKSQLQLPCQLISIILLTISSSFLIMLNDEQLRLPCRLLVLLLIISSSFIILLIDEQLRLPCRLLVLLLTISSSLSSDDLPVNV
jgi:hypothetical protein